MPKLSSREPCFVSILTVKVSSFQSCVDMMRYDSCCPATEEDAAKLIRLTGATASPADHIVKFDVRDEPFGWKLQQRLNG